MSLRAAILNEVESAQNLSDKAKSKNNSNYISKNRNAHGESLSSLLIENKLNSLFYLRDNKDEVRAGLHASSIIVSENELCYREKVLSLLFKQNQGEKLPIKLLRIFAAGNSIHEKWQNLFIKAGIAIDIEARHFSEQYELYFTPDAVIKINGIKYVVEIKSMNTFGYSKSNSHPSGQKQLQLYMHLLGIPQGFVLAEDKNTQNWKPFMQNYDVEQVAPILGRLNQVQELKKIFLKNKEMPPRKCKNANTKKALGCNMRDACFNCGMGRIKL